MTIGAIGDCGQARGLVDSQLTGTGERRGFVFVSMLVADLSVVITAWPKKERESTGP